jgi:carbamoyl-phosphate synthase large subunit
MEDSLTLLFTSARRRNQLMDCFRRDAALLGVSVRVLAADLCPQLSSACRQADASFAVPRCTDPQYVPALMEICRREGVRLLVPTIDTEPPCSARIGRHLSKSE